MRERSEFVLQGSEDKLDVFRKRILDGGMEILVRAGDIMPDDIKRLEHSEQDNPAQELTEID